MKSLEQVIRMFDWKNYIEEPLGGEWNPCTRPSHPIPDHRAADSKGATP